jgi:hypothetical protein
MTTALGWISGLFMLAISSLAVAQDPIPTSITVPFVLDHNRMLVEAEIQRPDGTWRKVRLWVDTGSPDFFIGEPLARDLGIDLSTATGNFELPAPPKVRIAGMSLKFEGVRSTVKFQPFWLFSATHNDGNLPATVLRNYQVVFDYPKSQLTLAQPGSLQPRGVRAPAEVHPQTGIVQIDAVIDGDSLSFALDNGASYSFVSDSIVTTLAAKHADWPSITGALGCANMWGWWPSDEQTLPVLRLPEIVWGTTSLKGVAVVGVPGLGEWYSRKTASPVDGFLGPNAFKPFRVEIDYVGSAVYFEKGSEFDLHDQDLVGLTLRPEADSGFSVIGVAQKGGKPVVEGVEPGDRLLQVGDLEVQGVTMGTVIDALRGQPGDNRTLIFLRGGARFTVKAKVERFL